MDLYNNLEPPTHLQEIKEPEVLSDVYPAETPLIISKNNNNNKDSSNKTATPTFQMSNTFDAVLFNLNREVVVYLMMLQLVHILQTPC